MDNIDIIKTLFLTLFSTIMFVVAIIYYFIVCRKNTYDINKRSIYIALTVFVFAFIQAILARFFVQFPNTELNPSSSITFIVTILTSLFNIFVLFILLKDGQSFSRRKNIIGSKILEGTFSIKKIKWSIFIIFVPLLLAWSYIIIEFTNPNVTSIAESMYPEGTSIADTIYIFILVSVIAPIKEEIMFRHFGMSIISEWFGKSKKAIVLSIVITSVIFSLNHILILTEDLIKIVQVFPLGIVLGYVYHRHGLEHSVLMHFIFNTIVLFVG